MALADLSVRKETYDACRICPSGGPFGEFDLGDRDRPHPAFAARHPLRPPPGLAGAGGERRLGDFELGELALDVLRFSRSPARAHAADRNQVAVRRVHAEQQAADLRRTAPPRAG